MVSLGQHWERHNVNDLVCTIYAAVRSEIDPKESKIFFIISCYLLCYLLKLFKYIIKCLLSSNQLPVVHYSVCFLDMLRLFLLATFLSQLCADEEILRFKENGVLHWTKPGEDKRSQLEYRIVSPELTPLGHLEKDITFEGCEGKGCRIVLTLGDKEIIYDRPLGDVYKNNKMKIAVDDIEQIKQKKRTSCQSFLISVKLQFDAKGRVHLFFLC